MQQYTTDEQKRKFYDSGKWRTLSKKIKQRDNGECQECKRNGLVTLDDKNLQSETAKRKKIQLVVHHIKELERHPELALDADNLETICVNCHNKEHGRGYRGSNNKWQHDEKW